MSKLLQTVMADLSRYQDPARPYQEVRLNRGMLVRVLAQQGCWAGLEFRVRQWAGGHGNGMTGLVLRLLSFLSHKAIEVCTGISIARTAVIGPGLYIGHFGGIVLGGDIRLGENCNISQGVTIGTADFGGRRGSPTIGDRVYVGPGAKVFGPISIGNDAKIGANAVVNKDVPPAATAVGVPARVILGAQ